MKTFTLLLSTILAAPGLLDLRGADDLTVLSDEFDNPAALGNWQRLNDAEGWNADKLELHDIDTSAPGQMRIMPYTTSWYMDLTGPLVFKEVTGDFVVTLHLDVRRRNDQPGRPVGTFSLGGIMIRTPRAVSSANPMPDAAPGVMLPWPPAGYATDWTPDGENYLFLSYGNTDGSAAPNQWNYEVKTTIDGDSTLYFDDLGVPADTGVVTLQAIRIGSTFVLMRKHPGGGWIIENRYDRPDMPATLQVGITTYTDWGNIVANGMFTNPDEHAGPFHHNHNVMTVANGFTANPDLVVDAEYFRYARPPADLTEGQLQTLPLTSEGAGIQWLSATALADVLGDAVDQPAGMPEPTPTPAPLPNFQPDGEIGRKPAGKIGDGIYNRNGAGQMVRVKSKRRKPLRIFVRNENDGSAADGLQLRGTGGNRHFRVKYLETSGGGLGNVTAAILSGSFAPVLGPGEGVEMTMMLKRKGPRTGSPKRRTFVVEATSQNQPNRTDVVRGKVQSP